MELKLYDTLAREKRVFAPVDAVIVGVVGDDENAALGLRRGAAHQAEYQTGDQGSHGRTQERGPGTTGPAATMPSKPLRLR